MLVPYVVTYVEVPPRAAGAKPSHSRMPSPAHASEAHRRKRLLASRLLHVASTVISYWAMTTRRLVAAATVACGDVTGHVTAAATFVHVYHVPAAASWVLIVEPAGGV